MKEIIKNDAMKISQADTEYVYDENGLTYTEGEDGMLYPCLEKTKLFNLENIGRYGVMYIRHLFDIDRMRYGKYLRQETLSEHAMEFEKQAREFEDQFLKKYLKESKGSLEDPMEMVCVTNSGLMLAAQIIENDCVSEMYRVKEIRLARAKEIENDEVILSY